MDRHRAALRPAREDVREGRDAGGAGPEGPAGIRRDQALVDVEAAGRRRRRGSADRSGRAEDTLPVAVERDALLREVDDDACVDRLDADLRGRDPARDAVRAQRSLDEVAARPAAAVDPNPADRENRRHGIYV